MILEEVTSEPLIDSAYYVNQNLLPLFGQKCSYVHDSSIGLHCSQVSQMSLASGDLFPVTPERVTHKLNQKKYRATF